MADVIVGRNPVLEALRSGRHISRILVDYAASQGKTAEILRLAEAGGVPVEWVKRPSLDRRFPGQVHQGVVALAESRPALKLSDLAALTIQHHEPALYVVLDGIEDPHNLGAILRTAEAVGAHAVITRSYRAVGMTPAVAKAAAGAAEYIPLVQVANIAQALEALQKGGLWIVGIDMSGQQDYTRMDYRGPTGIVVGAEGTGISPLVKKKCDFLASIPMKGRITSLNASVAAAVVLYEALKQRMK